ncbi:Organic cation transporter protein [Toxocara canis]|uniref:Organic cation transporter protein n=1 Tax=Toxocara canis TaxID=6265 RepID=A0A0B2VG71_TOXCA|nr:Organic cation transporter protein [Toxocara canis]
MAEVGGLLEVLDDFGRYEISLFAITQLGYLPVVGSLLATNFFGPPSDPCSNGTLVNPYGFYSLLMEWQLVCSRDHILWMFSLTDVLSTTLMLGGLLGAFVAGFLADRYGRKPLVVGTMAMIGVCNALLCVLGMRSCLISGLLFLVIGAAAGGYMVVNLVLLVEAVEHSHSRLLIVSLNGWPLAMCFTAVIAFLTRHWLFYHAVVASAAFVFFAVLQCVSLESVRWLTHHNQALHAEKIVSDIADLNTDSASQHQSAFPLKSNCAEANVDSVEGSHKVEEMVSLAPQKYSYADLFKHRSIGISVVALAYCFTVSSFVSFSGYFHTSILPGGRFLNLFSMGLLKLLLGMIPFSCGSCMGRRPILLTSVAVATLASCVLTFMLVNAQLKRTIYVSMMSILMTSALDPNWKIMHLYSTELFPTGMRNMARGICQVGARLGGVLAPVMRRFYELYPAVSMAICACLLAVQWLVAVCVFPETSRRQLPDTVPIQRRPHTSEPSPCQIRSIPCS